MSTPRQERGVLADILADCDNCGIRDHKTQMYPTDDALETWLCHICGAPPPEGSDDDEGDGDHYSNGDQEPPTTPRPRSRRASRN